MRCLSIFLLILVITSSTLPAQNESEDLDKGNLLDLFLLYAPLTRESIDPHTGRHSKSVSMKGGGFGSSFALYKFSTRTSMGLTYGIQGMVGDISEIAALQFPLFVTLRTGANATVRSYEPYGFAVGLGPVVTFGPKLDYSNRGFVAPAIMLEGSIALRRHSPTCFRIRLMADIVPGVEFDKGKEITQQQYRLLFILAK